MVVQGSAGNMALSPASLSMVLTMTAGGAKNTTAKEMFATLGAPNHAAQLHAGWSTILKQWRASEDVELGIANRLFGDKSYSFESGFLSLTKQHYGAALLPVDFVAAPETQRKRINSWVAEKTKSRIKDLLPPTGVTANTRLALVNAVYFKGKWSQPFRSRYTADAAFTLASGKQIQTPTMSQTLYMGYGHVDGHHVAELDYAGRNFGAVFIVPKKGTLSALEAKLDGKQYARFTAALSRKRVDFAMPKFTIDPSQSTKLKELSLIHI